MSTTYEELSIMQETVLKILQKTTKHPKKIFIGYEQHKVFDNMDSTDPKIEIEWME